MQVQSPLRRLNESPVAAWLPETLIQVGTWIGKFRIVGELGRGGMGVVYEAHDSVLDRSVAIKLLPLSLSLQPASLRRFLQEARAVAKVNHPHVVAVYDADQFHGQYYIVLELVRGRNMQDVIRTERLDWVSATRFLADACRGMEVAHRIGLVHRDIKPSNLIRAEDGTVKLADFGLARPLMSDEMMTGSRALSGTPEFMSPEQCRSEFADTRSDIYAMGATYFALLTGHPPYSGDAPLLVMNSHLLNPVPDPSQTDPAIPAACSKIVRRAMAKDPLDRFQNAEQLLAALEALLDSAPTTNATELTVDPGAFMADSPLPSIRDAGGKLSWGILPPGQPINQVTNPAEQHRSSYPKPSESLPHRWTALRLIAGTFTVAALAVVLWILDSEKILSTVDLEAVPFPSAIVKPVNETREVATALQVTSDLPDGVFQLPGMHLDKRRRTTDLQSWSMDCPGIVSVNVAESGEFLVILTNAPVAAASVPAAVHPPKESGKVRVWSSTGQMLLDETLSGRAMNSAISPDSSRIAVGTADGQGTRIWNTQTWKPEPTIHISDGSEINALTFSNDGRWLAITTTTVQQDNSWTLWDLANQTQVRSEIAPNPGRLCAVSLDTATVSQSGQPPILRTCSSGGIMNSWSPASSPDVKQRFSPGVHVTAVAFSPNRHLVAAGMGKYFAIWNTLDYTRRNAQLSQFDDIDCVAFSASGNEICWAAGTVVKCVATDSNRSLATLHTQGGHVRSLAVLPESRTVYAACDDDKLLLWQIQDDAGLIPNVSLP